MMTEKPMQDKYIALLNKHKIPFIHIPNSAFAKGRVNAKHDALNKSCLKDFPDLDFQFNGIRYQREFGIKGRHSDRKIRQAIKMEWYASQGANVATIYNEEELNQDWKNIGLIT